VDACSGGADGGFLGGGGEATTVAVVVARGVGVGAVSMVIACEVVATRPLPARDLGGRGGKTSGGSWGKWLYVPLARGLEEDKGWACMNERAA
jgi:hypothetical protein